jgi:hypothetical protein
MFELGTQMLYSFTQIARLIHSDNLILVVEAGGGGGGGGAGDDDDNCRRFG